MRYYCQADGAQWNVKVSVTGNIPGTGLSIIRAIESDTLVGSLGNDGHIYAIAANDRLFDMPLVENEIVQLMPHRSITKM